MDWNRVMVGPRTAVIADLDSIGAARQTAVGVSPEDVQFYNVLDTLGDDGPRLRRWAAYLNANGGLGVARGNYVISSYVSLGSGVTTSLYFWGDNISLNLDGATFSFTVTGQANYRPIFIHGGGKVNPASYLNRCIDKAGYQIATATNKGSRTVTLTTATDAANFAVGDVAFLRSGQLLNNALITEPNAELLEVLSSDTGAGTVTFATPVAANYVQEYFASGTSGLSGGTVTANPARYDLTNVTDRVMRNFRLVGGKFLFGTGTAQGIQLWSAFDAYIQCSIYYPWNGLGSRDARNVVINMLCFHDGTNNEGYSIGPSTGCSDWEVRCRLRSKGYNYIHAHENVKRSRWIDLNVSMNGALGTTNNGAIDLNARATDLEFIRPLIDIGGADRTCIYIDSTCGQGGVITDPTLVNNSTTTSAIINNANNFKISGERLLGSNSKVAHRGPQTGGGAISSARTIEFAAIAGLSRTTWTVTACYFQYDQSMRAIIDVVQAFNAGATNTLSLGYTGNLTALINALPVTATGPVVVDPGSAYAGTELGRQTTFSVAKDLILTFNGTSTTATTGKAVISLEVTKSCRLD